MTATTTTPGADAPEADEADFDELFVLIERQEALAELMVFGLENLGSGKDNSVEVLMGLNHQMTQDVHELIRRIHERRIHDRRVAA